MRWGTRRRCGLLEPLGRHGDSSAVLESAFDSLVAVLGLSRRPYLAMFGPSWGSVGAILGS
eukprot:3283113-Pyramimonas_sp.AAC.1